MDQPLPGQRCPLGSFSLWMPLTHLTLLPSTAPIPFDWLGILRCFVLTGPCDLGVLASPPCLLLLPLPEQPSPQQPWNSRVPAPYPAFMPMHYFQLDADSQLLSVTCPDTPLLHPAQHPWSWHRHCYQHSEALSPSGRPTYDDPSYWHHRCALTSQPGPGVSLVLVGGSC